MLDSLAPMLLVGDMVLSGAVVEAEDVVSVASFTVLVGVGVCADEVDLTLAVPELGATQELRLVRKVHYNKIIACLVETS